MKQISKKINEKYVLLNVLLFICILFFLTACTAGSTSELLDEQALFTLNYGNFEDEIRLFDVQNSTNINTRLIMRDGFFYIVNGEAGKILQLTSYGDLIGIIYDETRNPVPSFVSAEKETITSALEAREGDSTKMATSYPFNDLGAIAVDSEKNIYVADFLPIDLYEEDETSGSILRQVILRFASDGTFIDYLAQDGLGGSPFPYIKSLHTTSDNELIAICLATNGYIVYQFSQSGKLLLKMALDKTMLPPQSLDFAVEAYVTLENIIPDYEEEILYLKADYYGEKVDDSTNVSAGIEFEKTLVYPFDLRSQTFASPISIPAFERSTSYGYSTETFLHPYSFLGVSEDGGLFFMVQDDSGLSILVTHKKSQRIVRHAIDLPPEESAFQYYSLSNIGIVTLLSANENEATVSWWRTDNSLNTIEE